MRNLQTIMTPQRARCSTGRPHAHCLVVAPARRPPPSTRPPAAQLTPVRYPAYFWPQRALARDVAFNIYRPPSTGYRLSAIGYRLFPRLHAIKQCGDAAAKGWAEGNAQRGQPLLIQ